MKAFINCVSYYLPETILTNEELTSEFPEWSVDKIAAKVGINQRHIANENETAGDLAYFAALKLINDYSIDKSTIDFILLCTQSPDYFLPTTACILQNRLCLPTSIGALDFNLGCSGYVYGLSLAKSLIFGGVAKNVLLLTAETYSKYIHKDDKSNRSIFGDGASATLISNKGFAEIGEFVLGTNGSGANNLIVETGCARQFEHLSILNEDGIGTIKSPDHLYMNGSEIFNFTMDAVPPLLDEVLKKNNLDFKNIDLFVFHQANKFMLNTLRKLCNIDREKFYIDMEDVGNTVSSTIPIALKRAIDKNTISKDNNVLLAGFGVGYSWGACILKFLFNAKNSH